MTNKEAITNSVVMSFLERIVYCIILWNLSYYHLHFMIVDKLPRQLLLNSNQQKKIDTMFKYSIY